MRMPSAAMALLILPLLSGCADTPPPGVDPVQWQAALNECRRQARVAFRGDDFYGNGMGSAYGGPTWEVVDPCMQAYGFPPPY